MEDQIFATLQIRVSPVRPKLRQHGAAGARSQLKNRAVYTFVKAGKR